MTQPNIWRVCIDVTTKKYTSSSILEYGNLILAHLQKIKISAIFIGFILKGVIS
jgi:hypothetical protein